MQRYLLLKQRILRSRKVSREDVMSLLEAVTEEGFELSQQKMTIVKECWRWFGNFIPVGARDIFAEVTSNAFQKAQDKRDLLKMLNLAWSQKEWEEVATMAKFYDNTRIALTAISRLHKAPGEEDKSDLVQSELDYLSLTDD